MRICLLTGGYPYRRDALGGWCRTLVDGLRDVTFDLLTITDREPPAAPAYPLPMHVTSAGRSWSGRQRRCGGAERRTGRPPRRQALLCQGLMDDTKTFAQGLRQLALLPDAPLSRVPLAELLLEAWRTGPPDRPPLPRLGMRDARTAATAAASCRPGAGRPGARRRSRALRGWHHTAACRARGALAHRRPAAGHEARAPVGRARPAEDRLSPAVRAILHRFRRSVTRVGYAEAGLIAPLSAYHHSWALRHGARPSRLVPVPAGAKPVEHPNVPENAAPALVWAGSGGPDSGLGPLLHAFGAVVAAVPDAVLHLVGCCRRTRTPAPNRSSAPASGRAVPVAPAAGRPERAVRRRPRRGASTGPADPPYRLVEAMMSGRAVIGCGHGPGRGDARRGRRPGTGGRPGGARHRLHRAAPVAVPAPVTG
jgi:hypothetical protein